METIGDIKEGIMKPNDISGRIREGYMVGRYNLSRAI